MASTTRVLPPGTYMCHDIFNQKIHVQLDHNGHKARLVFHDDTSHDEIVKGAYVEYRKLVNISVVADILEAK